MQVIAPVTKEQLLQKGQKALLKLEIEVGADNWINICDLDGKNYLVSPSVSLGGASMTPNPIASSLSVEISNEGGIFHPKHPTSDYTDYFKAGRKVRISVGAEYDDTPRYWRRIIGYIDMPNFSLGKTLTVNISGLDYMKALADTEFRKPDNYWGLLETFSSVATENTYGDEIYVRPDAMLLQPPGNDQDVVDFWIPAGGTFESIADGTGGSDFVGQLKKFAPGSYATATNNNLGAVVSGKTYRLQMKYIRDSAATSLDIILYESGTTNTISQLTGLQEFAWTTVNLFFVATKSCNVKMVLRAHAIGITAWWRVDQLTLKEVTGETNEMYNLPDECTGIYYVTLDGELVPYGKKDEGWRYDENAKRLYWDGEKQVEAGDNNLKVYYFTAESPENAVADILVKSGLYADRDAALAGMDFTVTGISIDQIWFEKTYLDAIKMLCERCDYRFRFEYDGTPVFKPVPYPKTAGNEDLVFRRWHISDPAYYEDRNEIRNRIVIKGKPVPQLEERKEVMTSELKGEVYNQPSIDEYGEHILSIKNHLFQDQASIDAMCATLLARYKDPKWYFDFGTPFNPAPLEIWDTVKTELRLEGPVWPGRRYGTFRYSSGVLYGGSGIVVNVRGLIRDIKINKYNITYKCEEVE